MKVSSTLAGFRIRDTGNNECRPSSSVTILTLLYLVKRAHHRCFNLINRRFFNFDKEHKEAGRITHLYFLFVGFSWNIFICLFQIPWAIAIRATGACPRSCIRYRTNDIATWVPWQVYLLLEMQYWIRASKLLGGGYREVKTK